MSATDESATAANLQLRGVQLAVGNQVLFAPLSCDVPAGGVLTISGPSGAGKSSLLAFICGVLSPVIRAEGHVFLGAEELTRLPPERRRVGILFQDDLLFPHLSVRGNLAFGMRHTRGRQQPRSELIAAALASVGLAGMEQRDPGTLSGGERARVALLRVLLSEPRAIVLDEPFSKLDAATRDTVRTLVFSRCRQLGIPTLLVTHDADDVAAAGGQSLQMQRPSAPEPKSEAGAFGGV